MNRAQDLQKPKAMHMHSSDTLTLTVTSTSYSGYAFHLVQIWLKLMALLKIYCMSLAMSMTNTCR